ncbi:unnamed protein product [Rhizoctonia solani]|uniref:Zn(2)-C6 fungal-type domain-containing protein n=1 Tax=Rhizoctonia solani TaxID=456999 RepID=A0A8H3C6T9_9AGAM|nr:unnamed protein product [Rhizoctonia solani]
MHRPRPGPMGTSCLTCKRRRKKCDQRQPTCERCETGGFECLGYDHLVPTVTRVPRPKRPLLPRPAEDEDQSSPDYINAMKVSSGSSPRSRGPQDVALAFSQELTSLLDPNPSTRAKIHMVHQVSTPDSASSHIQNTGQPCSCPSQPADGLMSIFRKKVAQLPKSLPDQLIQDERWFIERIIAQTEKVMGYWYFNPPCNNKQQLHLYIYGRMGNTKFTRWILLAVMGVIESLFTGDMSHAQLHNSLIQRIEGSLRAELALELTPREMRNRWVDWIHVSLMAMLFNNLDTHQTLRRIVPVLLQVIYSNPALWSTDSDLTRVPLSNILVSASHELAYFAFVDCTYAMVSGLPQQVEYDTTIYSRLPQPSWHQLTHEFPTELLLLVHLLAWQSCPAEYKFTESWVAVAWYAVQESWRLALLIYLYLAVCNASSDDPRVQIRAKQIIQVAGTVKKRGSSDASASLCNQYLMAGICASSEVDRRTVREKLASANETKLWIMRASNFSPVLEHLWNGAGASGRPVRWSDFVHSREVLLPIANLNWIGASVFTTPHKKCDQRQPICHRCEAGNFECLGYDHIRRNTTSTAEARCSYLPCATENGDSSFRSTLSGSELKKQPLGGSLYLEESLEASFRLLIEAPNPDTLHDAAPSSPESTTSSNFDYGQSSLVLQENAGTSVSRASQQHQVDDYLRLFASRSTRDAPVGPITILRKIINLQTQIPYSSLDPLMTFLNSPRCVDYLLEQSDKIMDHWHLKPLDCPKKRSHQNVVLRLQSSHYSRWITLVTICIENSLVRELAHDLSPQKRQERCVDWIHISVVKTMVTHSSKIHQLLRDNIPMFLQLLFSDPTLWPSDSDFTYIPLSNLLHSHAHEAAYFALIDCTYAMASGLPQQLEYDTTMYQQPSIFSLHQWAHNFPTEFQLVLADINACRDQSPTARDWKDVETWLLAWQPSPGDYTFPESWMTVTWYAVQESWRLALLAYLYLAVCGDSSDEQRIQSCIKQIIQVVGTVKKRGPSKGHVSFFVQYLVVGICARSETHRKIARERLLAQSETRSRLIRASDFVPVLDHLWHGAAADGRPIKWNDYMRSREAVLPVII